MLKRSAKSSAIQTDCLGRKYAAQYNAHVCDFEACLKMTDHLHWQSRQEAACLEMARNYWGAKFIALQNLDNAQ